ncbi:MAG: lamin tail domain-containing protein, partial [Verrucomicrobiota bacterium]
MKKLFDSLGIFPVSTGEKCARPSNRLPLLFAAFVILLSFVTIARAQNVVINEIMFHPASHDPREEYVELYNAGATNVDLSGWRFTKGIKFSIPSNTVLTASNYLVIAGNAQSFTNKYPAVANFVGDFVVVRMTNVVGFTYTNYENSLSNTRDTLKLENAAGNTVDSLTYADEGDWAVRQRGTVDRGYQGWTWLSTADGLGKSLELKNSTLPNDSGQNWASSITFNGTPGRANSVASANIAPLVLNVAHSPIVPLPTDNIAVTARIIDELPNPTGRLFWRVNNGAPPGFTSAAMFDDGAHSDGLSGDGIYGAVIPAHFDGTIVEFYVEAEDSFSETNTWPRPAVDTDGVTVLNRASFSVNALFQVDTGGPTNSAPYYKVILTPSEE